MGDEESEYFRMIDRTFAWMMVAMTMMAMAIAVLAICFAVRLFRHNGSVGEADERRSCRVEIEAGESARLDGRGAAVADEGVREGEKVPTVGSDRKDGERDASDIAHDKLVEAAAVISVHGCLRPVAVAETLQGP